MDELMSTLEIDADADYLFEGFSMVTNGYTKRYLEAALTTPTQSDRSVASGRSVKDFHQHNRSIPTSYILMDNQSTVGIFFKPNLLRNIGTSDWNLHITYSAGAISVNQVGDLPGYGRVCYHPKVIANIIGLSNVSDNDT